MMALRNVTLIYLLTTLFIGVGGCSGDDHGAPQQATEAPISKGPPQGQSLDANPCTTASAGGGFVNMSFQQPSDPFDLTFRAFPHSPDGRPIDAVIGASYGDASAFTDLAAIVRFNPNGDIDVRRGSVYASDSAFPYHTNAGGYEFRLHIDVTAHRYAVLVKSPDAEGLPFVQIATDYSFRTEQGSVESLDGVGSKVDSAQGSVDICNIQVTSS